MNRFVDRLLAMLLLAIGMLCFTRVYFALGVGGVGDAFASVRLAFFGQRVLSQLLQPCCSGPACCRADRRSLRRRLCSAGAPNCNPPDDHACGGSLPSFRSSRCSFWWPTSSARGRGSHRTPAKA